ncbi:MAG: LysR family transcriptional regulator [Peptococcaceae bacterium]|nr:LysR family transcriptional regulator [Peptococcaceae bacterium]
MQLDQLKCFAEVAETKSFSKAAEKLFMTQQAISKNVKNLEDDLGCELFYRTRNGVVLTQSGEIVIEFAQKYYEMEKALTEKLGSIQQNHSPEILEAMLLVGSMSPIMNGILPVVLGRVAKRSNITTFVKIYDIQDIDALLEAIYKKELECGFVTCFETALESRLKLYDTLDMYVVAQDKLVAVINRSYYDMLTNDNDFSLYAAEKPLTAYNILLESDYTSVFGDTIISYSNDETFHRNMMKELGAITIMPEIVYQQKFSSKRYVSMEIEKLQATPLVHVAIHRTEPDSVTDSFFSMFHRELYVK